MSKARLATVAVIAALFAAPLTAAEGTKRGTPDLKSAGALAFGPDGLLLVGDSTGGAIFAIETGDRGPRPENAEFQVQKLDEKVAATLGTTSKNILINDLALNPASGRAYLSVSLGRGKDAVPAIVRVERDGSIEPLDLKNVKYGKAVLSNPPEPGGKPVLGADPRSEAITDLAYVEGRVFVAGLSNEEFSSRFLSIPYPFADTDNGTSIEIFHGAHGRFETRSPVRTFALYQVGGQPQLLAAYTCTPLVKIPVAELKPGSHVKGTTIAELGNRNRPLDMIVYQKDGKDYLLLANNNRGVMKIPTEGVDSASGIVQPVKSEKQGLGYETIAALKGVVQLDSLDPSHALILVNEGGQVDLKAVELP